MFFWLSGVTVQTFSKNHDAKVSAPQLPFQKCLTLDYTSSRLQVIKKLPLPHREQFFGKVTEIAVEFQGWTLCLGRFCFCDCERVSQQNCKPLVSMER